MKIGAFIIHLARAEQRKPQVAHILAACPVPARVIDAVDGSKLSEAEIHAAYIPEGLCDPPYPFRIGLGEIGCFLSHRRAWQAILDEGLDAGLIIEDDVAIDPERFSGALGFAAAEIHRHGYIQFQVRQIKVHADSLADHDGYRLLRPEIVPLRTSAQLVSARTAKRLLALTETFDRPIDGLLQLFWVTGLPISCVVPSGVSDRTSQAGGSTISTHKRANVAARLAKQYRRWIYRRAIARLSRRAQQSGPQS